LKPNKPHFALSKERRCRSGPAWREGGKGGILARNMPEWREGAVIP